ncbi:MAG TPA: serine/threonine-protein kinase, partial [Vicinamibacterales bacterium]
MTPNGSIRTIGRYQILEELGRGAMGIVYKGHDPVIGRTVALKTIMIDSDAGDGPDLRQRLYREACAAGTLTHANIVTVYDVIEEGGMTAVAMEFIEGETLKELITARAPLPIEMALDLFEQIAAALDYAGAKGVVHRDIKPANIMVTPDGRAKVADFGLARMGSSTLTNAGAVMGTPSYMSPEQARGMTLDGRSDLFSAAAVFYEMVTRQKVFAGKDLGDTLERIVRKPTPPANQFNPALDPAVCAVLDKALSKQPDDRYATGAALVKALRHVTETQALPTIAVPDAVDPMAKTIVMLPRSAIAAAAGTEL